MFDDEINEHWRNLWNSSLVNPYFLSYDEEGSL